MGNMNIVTAHTGSAHVKAADAASLNAALFGDGEYVLNRGNRLSASAISANTVRVLDGDIMLQGRHIRIDEGQHVDVTVSSGTSGYKRNDLIVCRYQRNSGTGVESAELVVIRGTPTAGTPSDPAYTHGDLLTNHATLADMPLYRVPLNGINVGTPVPLFTPQSPSGVPLSRTIAGLGLDSDITVAQLLAAIHAYYVGGTDVSIADGGTGASNAAQARTNLGITPANIGAKGTGNIEDIAHGGTGASDAATARTNLGAMAISGGTFSGNVTFGGRMILTASDYGTSLPSAGTVGRLFFKKV